MAGRFALVVGSECDRLTPPLSFPEECAKNLYEALAQAEWQAPTSTIGVPINPLINPSTADLQQAIADAFTEVNNAEATLLIAFIGHGRANPNLSFYLMATDSEPHKPTFLTAFDVTRFLQEQLEYSPDLDGLIFLIDACEAGQGLEGAAKGWIKLLADSGGRMDLLVASGKGSAYDGCFTKTILSTFKKGLDSCGDSLLCRDLRAPISNNCTAQAQHLDYSGADVTTEDRGLWLVRNVARGLDAVTGRPAAGLVDQLTNAVVVTASVRESLTAITDAGQHRFRLVVGAPGSGKSTLMALLIRPKLVNTLTISAGYVKAAVFLDKTSTLESLAAELNAQLTITLPPATNAQSVVTEPGFREAAVAANASLSEDNREMLGSFETAVTRPLAWLKKERPGLTVPVIVDGLDQPISGARELILDALRQLTHTTPADELGHVRVIAGVRSGEGVDNRDELTDAHRIDINPPTMSEIAKAVSTQSGSVLSEADLARITSDTLEGGWLIARLLGEIVHHAKAPLLGGFGELANARIDRALPADSSDGARLLSLIAAAGVGPVLPIRLLAAALGEDEVIALSKIRGHVLRMGEMISRGNPGTDSETLGISHLALVDPITTYTTRHWDLPSTWAHQALIDAYQQRFAAAAVAADSATAPGDVEAYWMTAAPRHYLAAGDAEGAIEFLRTLDTTRAAENRDRWSSWVPAFAANPELGQAISLDARSSLAQWRGLAGDAQAAKDDYRVLVDDYERVLGEHHPSTLNARSSLAQWRGLAGDAQAAKDDYRVLVDDYERVLGKHHPTTLCARSNFARWQGQADGDASGAVHALRAVLADQITVLGADHRDTLKTRNNLSDFLAQTDDVAGAMVECRAVLNGYTRLRDAVDRDVLSVRGNLAGLLGDTGNVRRAMDEYRTLRDDQVRVLGADHRDTLTTRCNIAHFVGMGGNPTAAVEEYQAVLADLDRCLGTDHPDTLSARANLDYWREEAKSARGLEN
jgi:hypothetical protein